LLFFVSLVGDFLLATIGVSILFQIESWLLLPLFATNIILVGQALSRRYYYRASAILLGLVVGAGLGISLLARTYSI